MDRLARRRTGDESGSRLTAPLDALFDSSTTRTRLRVTGVVQGVGFRPFVHRLATELGLTGSVHNDGKGVTIDLFGEAIPRFRARLKAEAPPLARIETIEPLPLVGLRPELFSIAPTPAQMARGAAIPADMAPCEACLAEARDPSDRRFLYPFLSCTDCGPRYTITQSLPFDRAATSMAAFPLCGPCAAEYADPNSRRFHAQTTCCATCGPRLSHPIATIVAALRRGDIVALKGLGGYHLACDARNDEAIARLREGKQREAKPFAVLVADVKTARRLACVDAIGAAALEAPSRPVLILEARADGLNLEALSGGLPTLGLMLPSSVLQALLLDALGPNAALVMTSGNVSGEPVIIDDAVAEETLGAFAALVVSHDRPILARADDGVARVMAGAARMVRRGRGAAPSPIRLASEGPDVLALGASLKVAACVATGRSAVLSPHVGDLAHPDAVAALDEAARHLLRLTGARPVAVAHDLHPDFTSTRLADRFGIQTISVQHHHAHALAVAAEHGVGGPFLAVTLDGFGLGERREAWGGEVLDVDGANFTRLAHLAPLAEPGGDAAAREPWRVAAGLLHQLGRGEAIARHFPAQSGAPALAMALAKGLSMPVTTSAGRWFDGAAALLGLATRNRFEGEAAMRLEALADRPVALADGWRREGDAIDLLPLAAWLADEADPVRGANLFHGTLVDALSQTVIEAAARLNRDSVALAGGCFLNRRLTEGLADRLSVAGLRVLLAAHSPVNDGGLALGQAVAARHVLGGC